MNCPRCGSELIRYREIRFYGATAYQCARCGFQWLDMGRPRSVVDFERELKSLWEGYKVYILHAIVVWTIASIVHFFLVVRDPLIAILSLRSEWLLLALTVLGMGINLGFALSTAILISGWWCPRTPAIHVILPLISAAVLGGMQGLLWGHPDFVFSSAGIVLRNEVARVITGALLGMCVTPIVIVRSSNVLKQKGLRPPLKPLEDDRWRF